MNVITKTRGDAPPFGKPRVIICPSLYHGGEAEVTDALLGAADVAVTYASGWYPVEEEDIDRLFDGARLAVSIQGRMRLSCLCVNDEQLLARVAGLGIPILPILFGECMDRDVCEENYRRLLGNRQYLLYGEEGFEESLRAYLSAHVADDQTRRLVAGAFRGRLFLSYRKRDGAEASRLVSLLHRLPDMEDVAVWIDDYLTPGEDYSDEIREALLGSDGVILCVTPSLLEEGNYVARVEYPLARERGIPVLPVVMEDYPYKPLQGDYSTFLGGMYPDFDARGIFRPDRPAELCRALEQILPPPTERTGERTYLLGLGYLSGIEVEQSTDRALALFEEAAKKGEPRAAEKLAELYGGTLGVRYSEEDSLRCLRLAADLREEAVRRALSAGETVGEDTVKAALFARRYLANVLFQGRRSYSSEEQTERMLALAEGTVGDSQTLDCYRAEALCHRGRCERATDRFGEAEGHLRESLALWRRLVAEKRSLSHRQGLAEALLEQATVLDRLGRKEEAISPAEEALALYDSAQEDNNHADRDHLLHAMDVLCALTVSLGQWQRAEEIARRFLREAERLCLESETLYRRVLLQSALSHMGTVSRALGDAEASVGYHRRALEAARPLAEETGDANRERSVFYSALWLGNALRRLGRWQEALVSFGEAVTVAERIRGQAGHETFAECLYLEARGRLCVTYYDLEMKREAEECFAETALRYRRLLLTEKNARLAENFAELLSLEARRREDGEALALYEEAVELLRPLLEGSPSVLGELLAGFYGRVAALERLDRNTEALSLAREALSLARGQRMSNYAANSALRLRTVLGNLLCERGGEGDEREALACYLAVLASSKKAKDAGISLGRVAQAAEELAYRLSDLSALAAALPHLEGTAGALAEHHERAMETFLAAGKIKEARRAVLAAIDHRETAFRREMTEESRAALERVREWHKAHTAPPTVPPREKTPPAQKTEGAGKRGKEKKPSLWQRLFGKKKK